jgi:hypothetical protein
MQNAVFKSEAEARLKFVASSYKKAELEVIRSFIEVAGDLDPEITCAIEEKAKKATA